MTAAQAKPKSVDAYIRALPPDKRSVAERMRAVIRSTAPEATEAVKYGMPAFLLAGRPFIYFAVWKKHVGVYPIYGASPELEAQIAPYRHKTDTVRFGLDAPIDYALVASLVAFKRDHAANSTNHQKVSKK